MKMSSATGVMPSADVARGHAEDDPKKESAGLDAPREFTRDSFRAAFAASIGAMLMAGSTFQAFGLFVHPVSREFGLTRAAANSGMVMFFFCIGLSSVVIGRLLSRYAARSVMMAGIWLFVVGYVIIASATIPWVALVGIALAALGSNAAGGLAAATMAARWFKRFRARAITIVGIATSAGAVVVVPYLSYLLATFGWRTALLTQAAVVAIVLTPFALLMVKDPPWLQKRSDKIEKAPSTTPWTFRELAKTPSFWLLAFGAGLLIGIDQALVATIVPHALDRGFALAQATLLMSVLAISTTTSKLCIAAIADRIERRYLLMFVGCMNIIFLSLLLLELNYAALLAACALVGIALGGTTPMWQALTADRFGGSSFAYVFGTMAPVSMFMALGLTALIGRMYDVTGSYETAFKLFAGLALLGVLLIGALGKQRLLKPTSAM